MYFSARGNNQTQTYTSDIKLGPETQNTRVSAPRSNGLALPPAAFLHTKYPVLEMYIPWAKAHAGPRHSGCSAHAHKQRPVQAPCGAESMWELELMQAGLAVALSLYYIQGILPALHPFGGICMQSKSCSTTTSEKCDSSDGI